VKKKEMKERFKSKLENNILNQNIFYKIPEIIFIWFYINKNKGGRVL
jgi:hypothetical protein